MAISDIVQKGLFEGDSDDQQLIRIPIRADENNCTRRRRQLRLDPPSERSRMLWTTDEHDRFLEALELYPSGPWKVIADHVGTRTTRQTMTHAHKYRQKIERRKQKERRGSIDSAHSESSLLNTVNSTSQTRAPSMTEPVDAPPADATEHAVLLEFLDNFHPSEIDHANPLPYTQNSDFLLDVNDACHATIYPTYTSVDPSFGLWFS
ncbi:Myb domain-contaning protein [Phytophthora cinnamomi]|uniref:Myb domain-contaning protein n=1 Tax=Phytophthora cinnamomi TaxID=4785 RepID=UPI00355A94B3|nr:Myb domain-contaning protein [Phytophthora cinnamomi]